MRWRTLLAPALVAGAAFLAGTVVAGPPADAAAAADVSVEDCADCHDDQVAAFRLTPHSALDREGYSARAGATSSCTACHGDATTHLEEGGGADTIFAFSDAEAPADKSARCQTCHGSEHPRFDISAHGRGGLDCSSCHGIHGDPWSLLEAEGPIASSLTSTRVSDNCRQCHSEVFAAFEYNERHRLQEGILECTSCHNPHAPATRWRLGGFQQEQCSECHVDKSGPFVFEHGSVRGEGCTSCHTPHGSVSRHMLTFQNVAELCYSCHVAVPGFHARFVLESQCTSCHSTIHGSNFDPFFLK